MDGDAGAGTAVQVEVPVTAAVPVPANGNGVKVEIHRDQVMANVLLGSIIGLVLIAIIITFKPPSEWSIPNKVVDILAQVVTGVMVGHFALRKA